MTSNELQELLRLRPAAEYNEDMGPVLWWRVPIEEPPYVGGPNDAGYAVELHTGMPHIPHEPGAMRDITRIFVGGWPGYHTHFSPLPQVVQPADEGKAT